MDNGPIFDGAVATSALPLVLPQRFALLSTLCAYSRTCIIARCQASQAACHNSAGAVVESTACTDAATACRAEYAHVRATASLYYITRDNYTANEFEDEAAMVATKNVAMADATAEILADLLSVRAWFLAHVPHIFRAQVCHDNV